MVSLFTELTQSDEIINFLKKDLQLRTVNEKVLYRRIINRSARERKLEVTPEEIQAEADRIRRENRLEKAADTLAWLDNQMITAEEWEESIADRLLEQKLAEHLFSREAEKLFSQNKLDYDLVLLYQIIVFSEKLAYEIFYQLEEKEISFYQAAHLYDIDPERRERCGFEGKIERWNLRPEVAAAVFGNPIGEAIEPLKIEDNYHILLVEALIPAILTPELKQKLQDRMFQQWLDRELTYLLHNDSLQNY